MGGTHPFGTEERASLDRAARTVIWGEHVTSATREDVETWGAVIRMYLLAADANNGSMHTLPFSGGLLEQPYRTMAVFEAIQAKFWERLDEQNKSIKDMR